MHDRGIVVSLAQRRRERNRESHGQTPPPLTGRHRPGLVAAAATVLLLLVGLVLAVVSQQDARDVAALAEPTRRLLYRRTMEDLRACASDRATAGPLRARCLERARFVLLFPECDDECRTTARMVLPSARK